MSQLLDTPSLRFGTSGLRSLATELQGQAARRYTIAFLRHLESSGQLRGGKVFLGRDFRPSSWQIMQDCAAAVSAWGLQPMDCGTIPTPALALHAMAAGCCAIMITGSHIPADRNGLKLYSPVGEIGKNDEAGITAALSTELIPDSVQPLADESQAATERYRRRCAGLLAADALASWRIGVFQHSSVSRDLLVAVLGAAGAEVVALGRADCFVPIDTEALDDAVFSPLQRWIHEERLDAIVSADGDGDRPLLMDETGAFVRGDVLGLLAARVLGARTVVTPVTANSAIEQLGWFDAVRRTKVGSPFVVAEMEKAGDGVVGFEPNGGTLVGPGISSNDRPLPPLPTRDAVLPLLCVLGMAAGERRSVGALVACLPLRHAQAGRLPDVPAPVSAAFLLRLQDDPDFRASFFAPHDIVGVSDIDGLQFRTAAGDSVHFRASQNAPELRCFVEGSTPEIARELLNWAMQAAGRALRQA